MKQTTLQIKIERTRKWLQFMESFQEIEASDPELAAEIIEALAIKRPAGGAGRGDRYRKIADVLVQNENDGLMASAIAELSGLKIEAVRDAIYKVDAGSFVKMDHPNSGVKKLFKLTEAAYKKAKEGSNNEE
jgi:hypothetical protein